MTPYTDHYDHYPTEYELITALDHDTVVHDFHIFDFNEKNAPTISTEQEQPHRHDYQEIIWIRKAPAQHLLDDEWREIRPNTMLVIPSGRVHLFKPSNKAEGCTIRFTSDFLPATASILFNHFIASPHIMVPDEALPVVESLLLVLKEEYRSFKTYRHGPLKLVLQALLAKIETFMCHSLENRHPICSGRYKFWGDFNTLIERHFRSRHTVAFYARELGLSPRKMNEFIKPILGKTANEVIDERRILEAKRLILFTSLSIKEIAFELGFEEHSYFSRVFKKITGVTPSEFKLHNMPT